jgi:foldase protein PrsA
LRLLLSAVLLFGLTACAGAAADATNADNANTVTQSTSVAQVATEAPPTDVIATVNGEPITFVRFSEALDRRQREIATVADPEALENSVLTELINQTLVAQEAEKLGIEVTDAEIDAEIASLKEIIENDEAAWQTWLDANGYTEDKLRVELRTGLIATRVRDAVVGDIAAENTRQVHARHILVDSEELATDIRARVIAGEDFITLAAQYSKDVTTKDQGGDLGWFTQEGLLEPVVAEVAFSQPEGALSAPVATRLGWHLIETLQFDDLPLPPEKQAEVAQVIYDEWLTTINDSAIIEIYR